ncbi:hypothetical protein PVAP13_3NG017790 [Panicum virgatum]|uniref:Uncharacterized protein n=1 Tax=Panicum virgatum TaxID=38727 RepID=A0A8T0U199_PANVG|nr:hypothetical protein PVAP13_3NG017790 [Panicum virgatum]
MLLSTAHSFSVVRRAKKFLGSRLRPRRSREEEEMEGRLSPSFPRRTGARPSHPPPPPASSTPALRPPTPDVVLTRLPAEIGPW